MCEVASFKNFENSLATTIKVMTETKVAPFYLGHGVYFITAQKHIKHHETVCQFV